MTKQANFIVAFITCLLYSPWALAEEETAPNPYGIVNADEAGPGIAPAADTRGLSFGDSVEGFAQAEATKPNNITTKGTFFDETNVYGHAGWSNWLSLNGALKYEHQRFNNIDDFYPDRNAFMRSEGLTVRQLYITVRPVEGSDDIAIYGGKIHPQFGTAWSFSLPPGIFYNFGNDYEQDEMIGVGGQVKIPQTALTSWLGKAFLSAETYFLDTTVLSNSLFGHPPAEDMFVDRPGRLTLADGGAANTNSLDSVAIALQGHGIFGVKDAAYHISYTHDGVNKPDEQPQSGFSIAGTYTFKLDENLTIAPYVEYARIDNFDGQAELDRNYVLAGLATNYGKWELDIAGGTRESHDGVAFTDTLDLQENISLSYKVMEQLSIGAGYNHIRVNDVDSNTVGLQAAYEFSL